MATKNSTEANLKDVAPEGIALSDSDLKAARKDGAKQDVADAAADIHRFMTDGNLANAPTDTQWHGWDETQQFAFYLNGSLDAIKDAYKDGGIPDNKLYGLLALERNGQNRTEYVKWMKDTLELKAEEIPGGGPSYTNDTTNVSDL